MQIKIFMGGALSKCFEKFIGAIYCAIIGIIVSCCNGALHVHVPSSPSEKATRMLLLRVLVLLIDAAPEPLRVDEELELLLPTELELDLDFLLLLLLLATE